MYQNSDSLLFRKEFYLSELIMYAVKKWYIPISIVLVSVIASAIYFNTMVTPLYSSTAKMYVINKDTQNITSSDLSISIYLSNDYAEIILDTPILDKVCEDLNYKLTPEEIKSFTSVNIPKNTRILEITATTPDAKTSKKIVDSICKVSQEELVEIMGLDRIKIIKEGTVSDKPSSPNVFRGITFAFITSVLIASFVMYIIYITDNKISSAEDVEKYLNLNTLATIPYNPGKQTNNK